MYLNPIRPKKISDQVFDQLQELIYRGELQPGDKLYPERELADILQVSRTTVRNAINKMVGMGLLVNQQGQGTFVRKPDTRHLYPLAAAMEADGATLKDLLEVRLGLECNSASFAALRATEKDLNHLKNILKKMEKSVGKNDEGIDPGADSSFHMTIAYATHNPVQIRLMKSFHDFLYFGIDANLKKAYENMKHTEEILAQHYGVLNAIQKKDPDKAFSAMKNHLLYAMDLFINSQDSTKK